MPSVIEFGAATGASAAAVFLGLAFWPQFEQSATLGRPAVSQPVFVVAPTDAAPRASAAASASSAPAVVALAPANATPAAAVASAPATASAAAIPAPAAVLAPRAAPVAAPITSSAAIAAVDAAAMAKLAAALQINPAPAATRSMSFAAADSGGAARVSDAARQLCAQGLVALASGDIAGARLFLERAADSGDARALLVLGETYDPVTLARMGALGLKGEAAKARDYYARALAAGMGAARERMAALEAQ